jgi:porin
MAVAAVAAVFCIASIAAAQQATPSQDVEEIITEDQQSPEEPVSTVDRTAYRALQGWKKGLSDKYGFNFAIENTAIYQHTTGGVDPNQALVNTLGLFATWKVYRSLNGKDFGGIGFQAEARQNPLDHNFPELTSSLGTLWAPNDSSSDDYHKINQLWWGMRAFDGRFGFRIGKIDPGNLINENRFAGSGNTQFFGQPFATNPARSYPDNGIGMMLRYEPTDWMWVHYTMSDSDAVSTYSPFKTIHGRWVYEGEVGFKPVVPKLGPGIYRFMIYDRDAQAANEVGWALSFDQNISPNYGVFLRYGGNEGTINKIRQLVSAGFSFLTPFDRPNDQAGIGISYTHPTSSALRDEYSSEVYYRLQVTEGFELSASSQLVINPSASTLDTVGVFGLRARLLY